VVRHAGQDFSAGLSEIESHSGSATKKAQHFFVNFFGGLECVGHLFALDF
jgi:hypothetical protein